MARRDLASIFRFLVETHHHRHGYDLRSARDLAAERARAIDADLSRLADAPGIGTRMTHRGRVVRYVAFGATIFWFEPDDAARVVRVLGIFHGGQDHLGRMLSRLTAEGDG